MAAQSIAIPGRRVSDGETFYTDWVPRGGDCILMRVQVLFTSSSSGSDTLEFDLETRGEEGSTVLTSMAAQ
jgi:hypothetical protein